jgi:hypothetical protein
MYQPKGHTQLPLQELVIDITIFSSGRVSDLIAQVKDIAIGVGSYREVFTKEAKAQELDGNQDIADTLQVLYIVSDFWLRSGDKKKPFQPSSFILDRKF